jgi:hypothetical protein
MLLELRVDDLRTGASADGRGCRLATAPRVVVDPATDEVRLGPLHPPRG